MCRKYCKYQDNLDSGIASGRLFPALDYSLGSCSGQLIHSKSRRKLYKSQSAESIVNTKRIQILEQPRGGYSQLWTTLWEAVLDSEFIANRHGILRFSLNSNLVCILPAPSITKAFCDFRSKATSPALCLRHQSPRYSSILAQKQSRMHLACAINHQGILRFLKRILNQTICDSLVLHVACDRRQHVRCMPSRSHEITLAQTTFYMKLRIVQCMPGRSHEITLAQTTFYMKLQIVQCMPGRSCLICVGIAYKCVEIA